VLPEGSHGQCCRLVERISLRSGAYRPCPRTRRCTVSSAAEYHIRLLFARLGIMYNLSATTQAERPNMCGRYTLSRTQEIRERFFGEGDGVDESLELTPRYNAGPDQNMPVVVQAGKKRLELMKWGLIPSWSIEYKSVSINARIEGIMSKPWFQTPIRLYRCLIPATGFYEWKRGTPYYIRRKDRGLFAFAGIYDTWTGIGSALKTFAIVTTAPNDFMTQIHDRMPVILQPDQEDIWLTTAPAKTCELLESLRSVSPDQMEMYPVSTLVNSALNEGPELTARVEVGTQTLFPM
jgi:putative SOS response-associated peptidase YedK